MSIQITSITVKNIRCLSGVQQLELDSGGDPDVEIISGDNATGKTTLVDSINYCLTGRFETDPPHISEDIIDSLGPGDHAKGEIKIVISDSRLGRRFQLSRGVHTVATQQQPVTFYDSLRVKEENNQNWASTSSGKALSVIFPVAAVPFTMLNERCSLGFQTTPREMSWNGLVGNLSDVAVMMAAVRGDTLSKYFSSDERLRKELISRTNTILSRFDGRYRVDESRGQLVGRSPHDPKETFHSLPTGEHVFISQILAIVIGELMPAAPPIIGDSVFACLDLNHRKQLLQLYKQADRQTLLFGTDHEFRGLGVTPRSRLEFNEDGYSSRIISI